MVAAYKSHFERCALLYSMANSGYKLQSMEMEAEMEVEVEAALR